LKKGSQTIELGQVSTVNHRRHGDPYVGFVQVVNGPDGFFEGSVASDGFMTFFHPVETDLNLVDKEFSGDFSGDQRAVGEENGSKGIVSKNRVYLPKMRVEQRLPSGQEESQPLNLFKLVQHLFNLLPREVLMGTFTDVAVAAPEVTPVGDLELKVPEGRDRGRIQNDLPRAGSLRKGDQVFVETKPDEFVILLPYGRAFTPADAEKKLIPIFVQLIKFVFFNVVEVAFFEVFQNSVRGKGDDPILGRHRRSPRG
jgi:hypothetical protein